MSKSTFGIVAVVLVLIAVAKSKTANLNQNQSNLTANPGQLTRNPLDGQLYYYFDPTSLGTDAGSDSVYGTPTVAATASQPWNEALGNGNSALDPNVVTDSAGQQVKWQW